MTLVTQKENLSRSLPIFFLSYARGLKSIRKPTPVGKTLCTPKKNEPTHIQREKYACPHIQLWAAGGKRWTVYRPSKPWLSFLSWMDWSESIMRLKVGPYMAHHILEHEQMVRKIMSTSICKGCSRLHWLNLFHTFIIEGYISLKSFTRVAHEHETASHTSLS